MKLRLQPETHPLPPLDDLFQLAHTLVDSTRELIVRRVRDPLAVTRKADRSFVTDLDLLVEKEFRHRVAKEHPESIVLGEEFPAESKDSPYCWVIDPIDGTAELVGGLPTFGTVIGLLYHGYPVLGVLDFPLSDLRISAARGKGCFRNGVQIRLGQEQPEGRRIHLPPAEAFFRRNDPIPGWYHRLLEAFPANRTYYSCLSLAAAATGGVDASVEQDLRIWDFSAAPVIVEEAGGRITLLSTRTDDEGETRYNFVLGHPTAVEEIATLIGSPKNR